MQMNNLYIKLGYDFYRSNNYFITPSINSGICFTKFTGVQCLKTQLLTKQNILLGLLSHSLRLIFAGKAIWYFVSRFLRFCKSCLGSLFYLYARLDFINWH